MTSTKIWRQTQQRRDSCKQKIGSEAKRQHDLCFTTEPREQTSSTRNGTRWSTCATKRAGKTRDRPVQSLNAEQATRDSSKRESLANAKHNMQIQKNAHSQWDTAQSQWDGQPQACVRAIQTIWTSAYKQPLASVQRTDQRSGALTQWASMTAQSLNTN